MEKSLTTRLPYGEGYERTLVGVAGLPSGSPGGRGLSLDDSISGYKTFAKPEDDNGTNQEEQPRNDDSIHRVDGPRDLPKKSPNKVDVVDQSHAKPSYMGLGKPHQSPKTKYPYRDGKPNTHNASAEFVAGMWHLQNSPELRLRAGARTAATVTMMTNGLNPATVMKSQSCKTTLKRADLKNLRWIFAVDCGNGPRVVRFKTDRKGNVTKFMKMDFHVACSCPAWRWQGPEFHSTTKDFQDPKTPLQGTASPPDIRDPDRINMVCKHVAAVLTFTRGWTIPKAKAKPKLKSKPKSKKK